MAEPEAAEGVQIDPNAMTQDHRFKGTSTKSQVKVPADSGILRFRARQGRFESCTNLEFAGTLQVFTTSDTRTWLFESW